MTEADPLVARIALRQPEFAAKVLEQQPVDSGAALLVRLPADSAAAVLACMLPRDAAARARLMKADELGPIVCALSPTTAASFLRLIADRDLGSLLGALPERTALPLRFVLRYSAKMIGAWMEAGGFVLPLEATLAEACERARIADQDLERMLFIVDRAQKLRGAVPAAALLRESPERPVADLLQPVPFVLRGRADLHVAIDHPGWQKWDPLPVVDRDQRVVGLLHHHALRAALRNASDAPTTTAFVDGSLAELLDLSWQSLADLLDGLLRVAPGLAGRRRDPHASDG